MDNIEYMENLEHVIGQIKADLRNKGYFWLKGGEKRTEQILNELTKEYNGLNRKWHKGEIN